MFLRAIERSLPEPSIEARLREVLARIGFLTVPCKAPAQAYAMLGALHRTPGISKEPSSPMFDSVYNPTAAGYRALHSQVRVVGVEAYPVPLNVRLALPSVKRRPMPIRQKIRGKVRVYTPAGDLYEMEEGDRVLHFALRVMPKEAAMVSGARINYQREATPLDKLSDGDLVFLRLGDRPIWQDDYKDLGASSRGKLRNSFRKWLKERGVDQAARYIVEGTKSPPPLPEEARSLLEAAWRSLGWSEKLDWAQEQLGLLYADERSILLPPELVLTKAKRGEIPKRIDYLARAKPGETPKRLDKLIDVMRLGFASFREGAPYLVFPPDLRLKGRQVLKCPKCPPIGEDEALVTEPDSELVLHSAEAKGGCGNGGRLVKSLRALDGREGAQQKRFVHIEAQPRAGLVADVLRLFNAAGVGVCEVVGREVHPNLAVMRIEVRLEGNPKENARLLERVILGLRSVQVRGIHFVHGPSDPVPQAVLRVLPPPAGQREHPIRVASPFRCGSPVHEDDYFYGRGDELETLRGRLEITDRGTNVFIKGPLKVGKTSLALHFCTSHNLAYAWVPTIPRSDASQIGDDWGSVEAKLARQLSEQLGQSPERPGLWAVVDQLRSQRKHVVLIVDECQNVLRWLSQRAKTQGEAACAPVREFLNEVWSRPGVMLLWIGPEAVVRELDPELQNILASGEKIRLGPLNSIESEALLRAQKSKGRMQIVLGSGVSQAAYDLTRGDPYWLNHLGSELWKTTQMDLVGRRTFAHEVLDSAVQKLIQLDPEIFALRVNPSPWVAASWIEHVKPIAREFGLHVSAGLEGDPGLSPQELVSRGYAADTVQTVLTFLSESGAIRQIAGGRFILSAPLLARWLREGTF